MFRSQDACHSYIMNTGIGFDEAVATYAELRVAKRHFLVRTTEEATYIYQDGNCLPLASYRQILRGIAWKGFATIL